MSNLNLFFIFSVLYLCTSHDRRKQGIETNSDRVVNPFQASVAFHIETSQTKSKAVVCSS